MDRMTTVVRGEAARSGRDDEAGGESLQVPFEWAVERLVEVVDVEDLGAFG